jgi:hypothetical protein
MLGSRGFYCYSAHGHFFAGFLCFPARRTEPLSTEIYQMSYQRFRNAANGRRWNMPVC